MTKVYSSYATLILLLASGASMDMVVGDRCKEDTGVCDVQNDCNSKCSGSHQGAQGLCESSGGVEQHCWCYYDCPNLERCYEDLGHFGRCDALNAMLNVVPSTRARVPLDSVLAQQIPCMKVAIVRTIVKAKWFYI
ncbi:hypothetical protein VNO77_23393 [Canavalia gladiata]|uniref:Uncharacterized protein n=1 Tax=Canavalia gladiata TaxID=3824 RepID=A0AAN9QBG6_CANGL